MKTSCNISMKNSYKNFKFRTNIYVPKISYNDSINPTSHENMFYIFYIGRYLSKPLYIFGETNDIYSTECYINNTLPYYKLVKTIPIEDNVSSLQKFNDFIECNKTEIPINNVGIDNVFTLDNNINIDMVLLKVDILFPSSKDI